MRREPMKGRRTGDRVEESEKRRRQEIERQAQIWQAHVDRLEDELLARIDEERKRETAR